MPNYTRMLHFPFDSEERAKHVEAAIEKLEYAIGHPCSVRFTLPTSFVVSCHVNVRSVSAPNRTSTEAAPRAGSKALVVARWRGSK